MFVNVVNNAEDLSIISSPTPVAFCNSEAIDFIDSDVCNDALPVDANDCATCASAASCSANKSTSCLTFCNVNP